ncbi:2-oxoisovalerate dehydrogenase subunit alpha, mitochondrial [Smittium culicis]|uniref:2-oxoisovalerate dehydrogenase subunit alpha n=1 Tax=Smittium culicis TaxID=133412 RepID=A0A1R1YAT7_9FUNG|nr:2-oxoisovalerate dehydrogenase subunit alpha, mitochondrial [Smittium culicis]
MLKLLAISRNSIYSTARLQVISSSLYSTKPINPKSARPEVTNELSFIKHLKQIPMYSVMDQDGIIKDKKNAPDLPKDLILSTYKNMLTINSMDQILYEAQRQGRISFYMTSFGEEAVAGLTLALNDQDNIFSQYRESVVFLQRGSSIEELMNQCFSNHLGHGKGRQMPIHYGNKKLNLHTISSPLATQIPQAVGTAYAQKREGKKNCTVCFFGEGAASEGDFHAALNMSSTLGAPVIFYCRNNGYAISTPSSQQFKGDGISKN